MKIKKDNDFLNNKTIISTEISQQELRNHSSDIWRLVLDKISSVAVPEFIKKYKFKKQVQELAVEKVAEKIAKDFYEEYGREILDDMSVGAVANLATPIAAVETEKMFHNLGVYYQRAKNKEKTQKRD